jgi:hypothetical protein
MYDTATGTDSHINLTNDTLPSSDGGVVVWVEQNRHRFGEGDCIMACDEMERLFPDLTHVCGSVVVTTHDGETGPGDHDWMVTSDGHIIDPTSHQFRCVHVYKAEQRIEDYRVVEYLTKEKVR